MAPGRPHRNTARPPLERPFSNNRKQSRLQEQDDVAHSRGVREVWRSKRSVPGSRRRGGIGSCPRSRGSPKGSGPFRSLTSALADLGFTVADIHGLAITHYHRDHIGLVPALLADNPEAWVATHGEDLRSVKRFFSNTVDFGTGIDPNLRIARAYRVP